MFCDSGSKRQNCDSNKAKLKFKVATATRFDLKSQKVAIAFGEGDM
jgi:hypothetical protein